MKQFKILGVGLAALLVLTGCAEHTRQHIANMSEEEKEVLRGNYELSGNFGSGFADFGNAHRANKAMQIIDPAPAYAEDPPDADGQRILGAYGRYRTDKVKPPAAIGVGD